MSSANYTFINLSMVLTKQKKSEKQTIGTYRKSWESCAAVIEGKMSYFKALNPFDVSSFTLERYVITNTNTRSYRRKLLCTRLVVFVVVENGNTTNVIHQLYHKYMGCSTKFMEAWANTLVIWGHSRYSPITAAAIFSTIFSWVPQKILSRCLLYKSK